MRRKYCDMQDATMVQDASSMFAAHLRRLYLTGQLLLIKLLI